MIGFKEISLIPKFLMQMLHSLYQRLVPTFYTCLKSFQPISFGKMLQMCQFFFTFGFYLSPIKLWDLSQWPTKVTLISNPD